MLSARHFIIIPIVAAMTASASETLTLPIAAFPQEMARGERLTAWEKDHVYVLEFWATWCGPCIGAMPHMQELYEVGKKTGKVHVIGMNVDTNKSTAEIKDFLKKRLNNISYPMAMAAADANTSKDWIKPLNFSGIPFAAVVKNGEVIWQGNPRNLTSPQLREMAEVEFKPGVDTPPAPITPEQEAEKNWEDPGTLFRLAGRLYYSDNASPLARKCVARSIELKPSTGAHELLGRMLNNEGKPAEAAEQFFAALKLSSSQELWNEVGLTDLEAFVKSPDFATLAAKEQLTLTPPALPQWGEQKADDIITPIFSRVKGWKHLESVGLTAAPTGIDNQVYIIVAGDASKTRLEASRMKHPLLENANYISLTTRRAPSRVAGIPTAEIDPADLPKELQPINPADSNNRALMVVYQGKVLFSSPESRDLPKWLPLALDGKNEEVAQIMTNSQKGAEAFFNIMKLGRDEATLQQALDLLESERENLLRYMGAYTLEMHTGEQLRNKEFAAAMQQYTDYLNKYGKNVHDIKCSEYERMQKTLSSEPMMEEVGLPTLYRIVEAMLLTNTRLNASYNSSCLSIMARYQLKLNAGKTSQAAQELARRSVVLDSIARSAAAAYHATQESK